MTQHLDPLVVVVLLLNFVALGASHLRTVIRTVAVQGVLLGLMMLLLLLILATAALIMLEHSLGHWIMSESGVARLVRLK